MDKERVAKELVKVAKLLVGQEMIYEQFDKKYPKPKDKAAFAKKNGGKVSKWKFGTGWDEVISYKEAFPTKSGGWYGSEDSVGCVLYAMKQFYKSIGENFDKVLKSIGGNPSKIDEWSFLCSGIPTKWTKKNIQKLYNDLEDINAHKLARILYLKMK